MFPQFLQESDWCPCTNIVVQILQKIHIIMSRDMQCDIHNKHGMYVYMCMHNVCNFHEVCVSSLTFLKAAGMCWVKFGSIHGAWAMSGNISTYTKRVKRSNIFVVDQSYEIRSCKILVGNLNVAWGCFYECFSTWKFVIQKASWHENFHIYSIS